MPEYCEQLLSGYTVAVGCRNVLPGECKAAISIYNRNFENHGKDNHASYALLSVPVEILESLVMQVEPLKQFGSFQKYHEYYKSRTQLKSYEKIYPVIIDTVFGCVIEDGWNRFHSYVEVGIQIIPCLIQVGE